MNKILIMIIVFFGILIMGGCMEVPQSFDPTLKATQVEQKADPTAAKRFQETESDGPTAVESAIELSKKYAALTEETATLKLEKQNLLTENKQLTQTVKALESELTQAKKELSEANDLLIEMRIELNNWKADVLGFRDEMRKADKAQLETLLKILKVLGGEAKNDLSSETQPQSELIKSP